MTQEILLGDEAVALGAIDAGISAAYAYPGTPSTEIFQTVQDRAKREKLPIRGLWSANEKVALEEGAGVSYCGKRALVAMKHVGLNVAADPFMNLAVAGAHGGLVIAVADDPSMHSSQNEQDSRHYADFAQIPCLEPADQQQCYDFTREAFDLSERLQTPVLLRLVTRLAHSRARGARWRRRAGRTRRATSTIRPGSRCSRSTPARPTPASSPSRPRSPRGPRRTRPTRCGSPATAGPASSRAGSPGTTCRRRWVRRSTRTTCCASAPTRCRSPRSGGCSTPRAKRGSWRRATRSSSAT